MERPITCNSNPWNDEIKILNMKINIEKRKVMLVDQNENRQKLKWKINN